jgi:hypothetical protein
MLHFSVLLFCVAVLNVLSPALAAIAIAFGLSPLLTFWIAVMIGIVIGYAFRAAIASELSKLSVSAIVARLEVAATKDFETLKAEAASVASDLKKKL